MLKRGIPLQRAVAWWAERPARLANLHKRKGRLAPGFDADIVVRYCMEMCCTMSQTQPAKSARGASTRTLVDH
jgi:allantoinase